MIDLRHVASLGAYATVAGVAGFVVCAHAAPGPAPSASPIAMTLAAHGSTLDVTLRNVTAKPISIESYVQATHRNYDALTVILSGNGARRELHFTETRTKAWPVDEEIAPGNTNVQPIDLVPWAFRAGNGPA